MSVYGFAADPATVADHIAFLGGLMPSGALDLISSQLESLAGQDRDALSFCFLLAFLAAFWSANNGVKTLLKALNIAYGEREKRSFIRVNLLAFGITLGAIAIAMIVAVGIVPAALALLRLDGLSATIISVLRWPSLLLLVAGGISIVYRFGPSRESAKWRWITWGGALATMVWMAASAGFSYCLQNFADYNATYGSLGAAAAHGQARGRHGGYAGECRRLKRTLPGADGSWAWRADVRSLYAFSSGAAIKSANAAR